jgi:hypothetical protein
MTCRFCGATPTIRESHVIPKFVARYLLANSTTGTLLNLWDRRQHRDIWKGSYFCAKCDNQTFSGWEGHFSRVIWRNPDIATTEWCEPASLAFMLSLAFRVAVHAIETSPIPGSLPYNEYFRDLTKAALLNPSLVGQQIFIYPYVYRPLNTGCQHLPGVNHFLTCAVHGQGLPREEDLPNAYLVVLPRILLLFCDSDLNASHSNGIANPVTLRPGGSFDPATNNTDMPTFLATPIRRLVGQGQAQQRSSGFWASLPYKADRLMHPKKACYVAAQEDQRLKSWQQAHC